VVKLYREGLETLRKKEMKRLKNEVSEDEYKLLANVMWLLRKSFNELSVDEQKTLNKLFILSPQIKLSYDLCALLSTIYNSHITKGEAKRKFKGWMRRVKNSGLTCFNTFIKTLLNNMEEITNYFINRQSSGFVEGLNNKLKVIKRRCYGLTNIPRFLQRIRLDLEGYAMLL